MGQTVCISAQTHEVLRRLSDERGQPMTEVLAEAVERLRREDLLRRTNEAYARLRQDAETWAEEMDERAAWEATLGDGLESDK
ncbi:MAG: toxin-antitoxin system protein [Armatimonadota bacterium]